MKFQLASILGLLALSEASVLDRRQGGVCHHDLCLRAIIPEYSGAQDCANYWPNSQVTVTPTAVTVTISTTTTASFTQTDTQTDTNTVYETKTFTEATTIVASTVSVTATITTALPSLTTLFKRQGGSITFSDATTTALVPSYVSKCSGWIRYSSACSCLTKDVVTAAAPTTTIIIGETISTTATIAPTLVTVTDIITSASTTVIEPVTTVTESVTVATVAWAAVHIMGRDDDENKANQYLMVGPEIDSVNHPGVRRVTWTGVKASATKFNMNLSNGNIKVEQGGAFVCAQFVAADALFVYILSEVDSTRYSAPKLTFTISGSNNLILDSAPYVKMGYTANEGENWIIAKDTPNWSLFQATETFFKVVNAYEE
ncbi:hypothetical protein TWF730_005895 [Orbilia blumenaviensis]|uniref:Uncharacterized protein n=1 Tax=Orbilia blumenaviensis TaxID=1796055 RepID=A0AAV9VM17_9PEZI